MKFITEKVSIPVTKSISLIDLIWGDNDHSSVKWNFGRVKGSFSGHQCVISENNYPVRSTVN